MGESSGGSGVGVRVVVRVKWGKGERECASEGKGGFWGERLDEGGVRVYG